MPKAPQSRIRRVSVHIVIALLLQLIGGFVIGRALGLIGGDAADATLGYAEAVTCDGCGVAVTLTGVEVSAHEGSTLFVLRGTFPIDAETIDADLRLVTDRVDIQLRPTSGGGFELVHARSGDTEIDDAIGAGAAVDALVIDVGDPWGSAPVTLSFGLWADDDWLVVIPATPGSLLTWAGLDAPVVLDETPSTSIVATPNLTSTTVVELTSADDDPRTALSATCTVPGDTASPLSSGTLTSGVTPDARTAQPTASVTFTIASPLPEPGYRSLPPFVVVVALDDVSIGAVPGTFDNLVDLVGTRQLWFYWDGTDPHKMIRVLGEGGWSLVEGDAAEPLTIRIGVDGLTFWDPSLESAAHAGVLVVSGDGICASIGLDSDRHPTIPLSFG